MRTEFTTGTNDVASADIKAQRGINALDSTGELLMAIATASQPLNLRDLAAAAGMPPAKAFPHLVSLQKIGLVSRNDDGSFTAGPLGFELGLIALQRMSPTRDAEPEIASLAVTTQMTVAAATLGPLGPTIIRLEESVRPQHISLRVGTVMSLLHTAIGRVFAAHLPEDVLGRLLVQEPIRLAGVETKPALSRACRERLKRIRIEGIDEAFDAPVPGIGTFAAPVLDHTGSVPLVIAVIGSSASFDRDPHGPVGHALLAAAQRLSWRFGSLGKAVAGT
ncbi:IclR family transcriptional regulator [Caballeronia sp. LZ019]|uniref:IclR family transcriptional regulator n=1 Tax=Caballeronia sp. LZ019 TaxID=3038555 RepID=UPI0028631654|nr:MULTISPECIES: IclR family transcriptional regulator [unclassified Caballeronia]MDR5741106.1 IclR family transcriptional regulator [Caballeronia sp. LZ016]MDR5807006.1 IclR family transcriptional regulator [Caballeronia sp. LZ019]